uniref:ABC transmembrane type-1 domain-containing protein n=1 Tax=Heterorhabditis bacteriophora TaxID=37862 RepID=A0A1I7W6Z1_HETBA
MDYRIVSMLLNALRLLWSTCIPIIIPRIQAASRFIQLARFRVVYIRHKIIETDLLNQVVDNDIELGVAYMRKGLRLGRNMIMDAKLYHQLGHSLMYLGRTADVRLFLLISICFIKLFLKGVFRPSMSEILFILISENLHYTFYFSLHIVF